MVKYIDKLTPEQEAAIPGFIEECLEQTKNTDPINRVECERIVREQYRLAGLEQPKHVIFAASPRELLKEAPRREFYLQYERILKEENKTDEEIKEILSTADPSEFIRENWWRYRAGHMWPTWASWRRFFVEVCGLELEPEVKEAAELWFDEVRECGWIWYGEFIAGVCERPVEIHLDEDARGNVVFGNSDGPAVRYADGFTLYAVGGVRLPAELFEEEGWLTLDRINDEANAEVRRIFIERYGWSRYLIESGAKVLDLDSVPIEAWDDSSGSISRALVRLDNGQRYLVACDGSTDRTYTLRAPDTAETAEEAYQEICGVPSSDCIAQG